MWRFLVPILVLLALIPGSAFADEATIHYDPARWFVDLPSGSGSELLKLVVSNPTQEEHTYTVEYWNYRFPDYPGDPDWITSISPSEAVLPSGGSAIFNIKIDILEGMDPERYVMYVKIEDETTAPPIPVTIVARLGSAVPSYEFGMFPGKFQIEVSGKILVSERLSIGVNNTGSETGNYEIYARIPDAPDVIDPDFETGDLDWIEIPISTFEVPTMSSGTVPYYLNIPKDVPSGRYKVWVGVRNLNSEGFVQIEYAQKLLIVVERVPSNFPYAVVLPSSIIGIVGIAYCSYRYLKWKKKKNLVSSLER